jgi:hypothetical protein
MTNRTTTTTGQKACYCDDGGCSGPWWESGQKVMALILALNAIAAAWLAALGVVDPATGVAYMVVSFLAAAVFGAAR